MGYLIIIIIALILLSISLKEISLRSKVDKGIPFNQKPMTTLPANMRRLFEIFIESYTILKTSNNIDTAISRCDVLLNYLSQGNSKQPIPYRFRGLFSRIASETTLYRLELIKEKKSIVELIKPFTILKCPYCEYEFEEMPKRKRKCPECKETIFRVKSPEDKRIALVTSDLNDKITSMLTVNQDADKDEVIRNLKPLIDFIEYPVENL